MDDTPANTEQHARYCSTTARMAPLVTLPDEGGWPPPPQAGGGVHLGAQVDPRLRRGLTPPFGGLGG